MPPEHRTPPAPAGVQSRPHRARARLAGQAGFTLLELIIVIVVMGILAASISLFMRPALDSYIAVRNRADLVAQGDTALRRMLRDVRSAVPNSIRLPGTQCFEFVPTTSGGRYRNAADTANDSSAGCTPSSTCSAPLDVTQPVTVFDVLTPLSTLPAVGDQVVIGNQTPDQVYSGSNRASVTGLSTPQASQGLHRVSISSQQFPSGYDGGRFTLTPASGPVFFVCSGADGTLDAQGNGKGTLYRLSNYGWNASYPASCPATTGADVLATRVVSCQFVYNPNQGATQQAGFISLQMTLGRNGESTTLVFGAHVVNTP